ncbi:hypothetical protein F3X94_17340 [Raoultella planticola]|nr:hypothetical protein [Raoultella planticola]QEU42960.1 hypothetical protein F3X94_17340 [Raoultella planticola]TJZ74621.1 hypothetical protein FA013_02645 [Raoultella planticola]TQN57589.1 hypothetical protein FLW98_03485 [Raoultella planticola]
MMIHPHTPSAVCVLIGHMLSTDFSIYTYANAFCTKNALRSPVYCAESSLSSINKKSRRSYDRRLSLSGVIRGSSAARYAAPISQNARPASQITSRCLSGSS